MSTDSAQPVYNEETQLHEPNPEIGTTEGGFANKEDYLTDDNEIDEVALSKITDPRSQGYARAAAETERQKRAGGVPG